MSAIEEPEQDLLPGIPDEITLDLIATKLPWKAFHILSSLGRAWRRAIQSRKVYNARVRCQATETVVVIDYFNTSNGEVRAIGLYSVRDKSISLLPSIPNVPRGLPFSSQSVAIDGKIYVLGGLWGHGYDVLSNEVYVMDLAGQREWEPCKSMTSRRFDFAFGVLGGKIYVFGGCDPEGRPVRKSEVYDPQFNSWDPVKSMRGLYFGHQVAVVGEELFLHSGHTLYGKKSNLIEAYHPRKDEWREVNPFEQDSRDDQDDLCGDKRLFTLQGHLHSMTGKGIDVYDVEKKLWRPRHSLSPEVARVLHTRLHNRPIRWASVDADNELVTVISWFSTHLNHRDFDFLQWRISFGGHQQTVAWQKIECSHKVTYNPYTFPIWL